MPVSEFVIVRPPGHHCGHQTGKEGRAVEEHVERVGDEPKTVRPHAPEQLYEGKGEIEDEEEEEITSGSLRQDLSASVCVCVCVGVWVCMCVCVRVCVWVGE